MPIEMSADLQMVADLTAERSRILRRSIDGWAPTVKAKLHVAKEGTSAPPLTSGAMLVKQPRGRYPASMLAAGITGEVLVAVTVDAVGMVADAKILRSTQPEFEPAALRFARECQLSFEDKAAPKPMETVLAVLFEIEER